jgi:hypothetical protein
VALALLAGVNVRLARSARLASALALASILAAGAGACVLHLGGDDDGSTCALDDSGAAGDVAVTLLLDPETLACVQVGFGGCGPCEPCPEPFPPIPTWGSCQSFCTGLAEGECARTDGCRTAYDHDCLLGEQPCPSLTPYLGCFAVDTTGPIGGACEGLAAFDCSRHDDCLATYDDNGLCGNGLDDDRDGQIDESDECRAFVQCLPELIAP